METLLPTQIQPPAQVQLPFWRRHIILICLSLITILSLSTTAFLLLRNTTIENSLPIISHSIISGTFDINGVIPQGATVVIRRKNALSTTDTANSPQNFPAVDQGTWSLDGTNAGKSYTLTAAVISNGKTIAKSDPVEVTAPATDETLIFNIPQAQPAGTTGTAIISGNILVDGYIPPNSTISVKGKMLSETKYTTVASNLPAQQTQFMSYATSTAGQTYQIIGVLLDSAGNQIGVSPILEVSAPALNEKLTINSQAQPPATPTPIPTAKPAVTIPTQTQTQTPTPPPTPTPTPIMISGSIQFNGVAPANSRIVILERVYNTQQYQVAVNNVMPTNGATWQWTGAQLATWYDIVAVLKQTQSDGTDTDIALSQTQSIAAPGANVSLTINSGLVLSPPSGPINASCGNLINNVWGGQMSYASVSNAQSYWLEVGTSEGANDTYNSFQNTNGQSNQTASVNFTNGVTYYARYAYATSLNATQPQFSPFSSTLQFICNQ